MCRWQTTERLQIIAVGAQHLQPGEASGVPLAMHPLFHCDDLQTPKQKQSAAEEEKTHKKLKGRSAPTCSLMKPAASFWSYAPSSSSKEEIFES